MQPVVRITPILLLGILTGATVISGEPVRLTDTGRFKQDPVFIKGGQELIYVEQDSPVRLRLMRMTLADRRTMVVDENAVNNEYEPAYSPDGRFVAFVQSRGNLSLALVIRDIEANKQASIDPVGGFCGYRSPAIAPDNSRVLYSFADGGRQQIYSATTRGEDRKPLTDSRGINNWPSFSTDGKRVAFGSSRDDDFEIYTMNSEGSHVRRLTDSPGQDIRPRFSPDGKRIAFTSNRNGNYEIYVMKTDGSALSRITEHVERDDYAAWHPDGKRLAIVCERSGRFDLYLVDAP